MIFVFETITIINCQYNPGLGWRWRPTVATWPDNWSRESISWTRCQDLDTPQWANIYFLRTFIVVLHNLNIVMGVGWAEGARRTTSQMGKSLELIVCNCEDEW